MKNVQLNSTFLFFFVAQKTPFLFIKNFNSFKKFKTTFFMISFFRRIALIGFMSKVYKIIFKKITH